MDQAPPNYTDENYRQAYNQKRLSFWQKVAASASKGGRVGHRFYLHHLKRIYGRLISPGQKVLEVGCGQGDLLASLKPSVGLGVDFCPEMIAQARERHPEHSFLCVDAQEMDLEGLTFDYIILSDLVNDLWDVEEVLKKLRPVCHPRTRIILNFHSRLWAAPLAVVRGLGLAQPLLTQNWFTAPDAVNLLDLAGYQSFRTWMELLWPLPGSVPNWLFNRVLARIWPIKYLALCNFVMARPAPAKPMEKEPVVSVIIASRNEAGNIDGLMRRTPEMGAGTELIFVEGHSTDDTWGAIQQALKDHPHRRAKAYQQTGVGKGDAVRLGFDKAEGDLYMIMDADLTFPPENLTRFYDAWYSGKGEYINGVRLVYPMEDKAMRPINFLGNKFFSLAFTWCLEQPIKDTLCCTKVLSRRDYEVIVANRAYFGDFDPFGDFDIIFGAAKQNMKMVDLPIRYRERLYGSTNISRWSHGWLLIKMLWIGLKKLKFV